MDDDEWKVDEGLATMRARIEAMLPLNWSFYGPIRRDNGWAVGARNNRPRRGQSVDVSAWQPDVVAAFRELADAIRGLNLAARTPN